MLPKANQRNISFPISGTGKIKSGKRNVLIGQLMTFTYQDPVNETARISRDGGLWRIKIDNNGKRGKKAIQQPIYQKVVDCLINFQAPRRRYLFLSEWKRLEGNIGAALMFKVETRVPPLPSSLILPLRTSYSTAARRIQFPSIEHELEKILGVKGPLRFEHATIEDGFRPVVTIVTTPSRLERSNGFLMVSNRNRQLSNTKRLNHPAKFIWLSPAVAPPHRSS